MIRTFHTKRDGAHFLRKRNVEWVFPVRAIRDVFPRMC